MYSSPGATSWASQILSNSVFGISVSGRGWLSSAAAQPGADHGQQPSLVRAGVLEVMRQVGVEGHAIAAAELVALTVADEHRDALLDERGLAAAGLVHRRVVGTAGCGARRQHVQRELGALSGPC